MKSRLVLMWKNHWPKLLLILPVLIAAALGFGMYRLLAYPPGQLEVAVPYVLPVNASVEEANTLLAAWEKNKAAEVKDLENFRKFPLVTATIATSVESPNPTGSDKLVFHYLGKTRDGTVVYVRNEMFSKREMTIVKASLSETGNKVAITLGIHWGSVILGIVTAVSAATIWLIGLWLWLTGSSKH